MTSEDILKRIAEECLDIIDKHTEDIETLETPEGTYYVDYNKGTVSFKFKEPTKVGYVEIEIGKI